MKVIRYHRFPRELPLTGKNKLDVEPACSIQWEGRPKHAEGTIPDRLRSSSMDTSSVPAGENMRQIKSNILTRSIKF